MSQTKLAARAQKLSRQIFASLPFEIRFGVMLEFFSDAAVQLRQTLGRVLYAEYIKAGVPDMPPIGDMPADQHPAKEKGAHAAQSLPRSYGGKHAGEVMAVARKFIPIEADVQEFLGDFLRMVSEGKLQDRLKSEGRNLKNVEAFTRQLVKWRAQDFMEKRRRETQDIPITDIGTGGNVDVEDPNSLRDVLRRIKPGDQQKMMADLRKIDPKHPEWPEEFIFGKLEGKTLRDMGPELGVDYSTLGGWWNKYEPKIQAVFDKYFWTMSEAV